MNQNDGFHVKYLRRRPYFINIHLDVQLNARQSPIGTVGDLIDAFKSDVVPLFDAVSLDELMLKSCSGHFYNSEDALDVLGENGRTVHNPLIVTSRNDPVPMEIDVIVPKNIIKHAFPPLGEARLSRCRTMTRNKSSYNFNFKHKESEFGILNELELNKLKRSASSLLWIEADRSYDSPSRNTPNLGVYRAPESIQRWVRTAVRESIWAAEMHGVFYVSQEESTFSFSNVMDKDDRHDPTVFLRQGALIYSVVDVNLPFGKPFEDPPHAKFDKSKMTRIADYMVDLRNTGRVRFVFGILTTYEEWMVLWFEDSHIAAQTTSKEEYDELCKEAESATEVPINENATIYHTKVYHHSDPKLIELLASFMYKVSKSPVHVPTKFIDVLRPSRYIYTSRNDMKYIPLPPTLKEFKYDMPPSNTQNFYILSYFHRGRNGQLALCTTPSGCLGVIKFLNDTKQELTKLEKEAGHWKTLWGVNARIVIVNQRHGLLMPFCLVFSMLLKKRQGDWFGSFENWNNMQRYIPEGDSDMLSTDVDTLKSRLNLEMLKKYQQDPVLAAKEALSVIRKKTMHHKDVMLRTLALFPQFNKVTKVFNLKPILIDLANVSTCQVQDEADRAYDNDMDYVVKKFDVRCNELNL